MDFKDFLSEDAKVFDEYWEVLSTKKVKDTEIIVAKLKGDSYRAPAAHAMEAFCTHNKKAIVYFNFNDVHQYVYTCFFTGKYITFSK